MSITTPIVYISDGRTAPDPNDSNKEKLVWVDVSKILISSDIGYGKNQPFMRASVRLTKAAFNSNEFWGEQYKIHDPTDADYELVVSSHPAFGRLFTDEKPNIRSGISKIYINTYGESGELTIVRPNDSDDGFIEYIATHQMYRSKSIDLDSIFRLEVDTSTPGAFKIPWWGETLPMPVSTDDFRFSQKLISAPRSDSLPLSSLYIHLKYIDDSLDVNYTGIPQIEMITGTPSDFFRFISYAIGGFEPSVLIGGDFLIDKPLKYGSHLTNPLLDEAAFSRSGIENLSKIKAIYTDIDGEIITMFRPEMNSWSAIKYLESLTLRKPFYYDKAYFVNYEQSMGKDPQFWDNLGLGTYKSNLVIDYGEREDYVFNVGANLNATPPIDINGDPAPLSVGDVILLGNDRRIITALNPVAHLSVNLEETIGITTNLDQGERYTIQSQTVSAENFEWTSFIDDTQYRVEGDPIYTGYPDLYGNDTTPDIPFGRREQAKLCALHRLIECYDPQATVRYIIQEAVPSAPLPPDFSIIQSPGDPPLRQLLDAYMESQSSILKGFKLELIGLDGSQQMLQWETPGTGPLNGFWVNYAVPSIRDAKYMPYSLVGLLEDKQSGIQIKDAPLAYTSLHYPQCVTELVWGYPEFQDSEQQVDTAEQYALGSTQEGTGDINISDKWASKLSIGNQSLSQIDEDFEGFTGIAIVKNRTADVYEIRGYETVKNIYGTTTYLNAQFTSKGEIIGGGGTVILNREGLFVSEGVTVNTKGIRLLIKPTPTGAQVDLNNSIRFIPDYGLGPDGPEAVRINGLTASTPATATISTSISAMNVTDPLGSNHSSVFKIDHENYTMPTIRVNTQNFSPSGHTVIASGTTTGPTVSNPNISFVNDWSRGAGGGSAIYDTLVATLLVSSGRPSITQNQSIRIYWDSFEAYVGSNSGINNLTLDIILSTATSGGTLSYQNVPLGQNSGFISSPQIWQKTTSGTQYYAGIRITCTRWLGADILVFTKRVKITVTNLRVQYTEGSTSTNIAQIEFRPNGIYFGGQIRSAAGCSWRHTAVTNQYVMDLPTGHVIRTGFFPQSSGTGWQNVNLTTNQLNPIMTGGILGAIATVSHTSAYTTAPLTTGIRNLTVSGFDIYVPPGAGIEGVRWQIMGRWW